MIIKVIAAWMMAIAWSGMIRNVLDVPADHILNWGGAVGVFFFFLAMARLFSDAS